MKSAITKLFVFAFLSAMILPVGAEARLHQDVVKDARGNVVLDSDGDCVRTMWETEAGGDCMGRVRSVYFDFNRSSLNREARSTLDDIASYIIDPRNNVNSINIVGYADSMM